MHVASSREIMEDLKKNNPMRWFTIQFEKIDGLVSEYNDMAREHETNLIGAFSMTLEEYEEVEDLDKDKDGV